MLSPELRSYQKRFYGTRAKRGGETTAAAARPPARRQSRRRTGEVGRARWRPAVAAAVRTRSWRCDAPGGRARRRLTAVGFSGSGPTGSVGGDPEADVLPGWTRERNSRSEGRRSMCSAIRANYRILLRPSSTREPSDPPLRVVRVSDALVYRTLSLSLSLGRDKKRAPSGRRRAATH